MRREGFKRAMGAAPAPSNAVFVSNNNTKAQFWGIGRVHDLVVECDIYGEWV